MSENFRILYQNNDMDIIFDLFTSLVIILSKIHVTELSYTPFYDKNKGHYDETCFAFQHYV